jgi:hypothetical protein
MASTTWPYFESDSWKRRQPLKIRNGSEKAESFIIYASTVAVDEYLRRIVPAGSLLTKITSGVGTGKYGPYAKTARDGRQTLAEDTGIITVEGEDVTLGDRPVAGWLYDCVFDLSELTTNGVSKHGTSLTSLKSAFPHCKFSD